MTTLGLCAYKPGCGGEELLTEIPEIGLLAGRRTFRSHSLSSAISHGRDPGAGGIRGGGIRGRRGSGGGYRFFGALAVSFLGRPGGGNAAPPRFG